MDGAIFLNKYVEFIKKKTIVEFKNNLKLTLLNTINNHQEALEIAKKVQLENPIIKNTKSRSSSYMSQKHYSIKVLKCYQKISIILHKRLIKLENDQFDYDFILQKSITAPNKPISFTFIFCTWINARFIFIFRSYFF